MTSYTETGFGPTDKHERRKVLEEIIPAVTAVFAKHGIQVKVMEHDLGFQLGVVFDTPDGEDYVFWTLPFYDHWDKARVGLAGKPVKVLP